MPNLRHSVRSRVDDEFLAALKGRDLVVDFVSADGTEHTGRRLENVRFRFTGRGDLVVLGFDPTKDAVRTLRVDRMTRMEVI